jgi:diadenosine tetraphosphatase ApaH/serine/threonine PP2A family protein phosphatase
LRTAFISDIHANLEALEAVLADIRQQGVDRIVCLGDIVGYGPDPNPCVRRVREVCAVTVVGNHDHAALGLLDTESFNEFARVASDWTSRALEPEVRGWLQTLPFDHVLDGMRLVHASPVGPAEWTYVLSYEEARRQFAGFDERLCFIGHSHLPILVEMDPAGVSAIPFTPNQPVPLDPECRYLVNVGSVGQPRDRDPRSGYAIHDAALDTVLLRRVEYAVDRVQEKILALGLPPFLAQRLLAGV